LWLCKEEAYGKDILGMLSGELKMPSISLFLILIIFYTVIII